VTFRHLFHLQRPAFLLFANRRTFCKSAFICIMYFFFFTVSLESFCLYAGSVVLTLSELHPLSLGVLPQKCKRTPKLLPHAVSAGGTSFFPPPAGRSSCSLDLFFDPGFPALRIVRSFLLLLCLFRSLLFLFLLQKGFCVSFTPRSKTQIVFVGGVPLRHSFAFDPVLFPFLDYLFFSFLRFWLF